MKTNKILAAGLAASAIVMITMSSVSAMNGQGQGQGQGQGNGQGMHQGQGQNNSGEMKQSHSPADMIVNIEKQDLSAIEIDLLMKQYEEEMMANELYSTFYEMYGVDTFNNIANSEAEHMTAVKSLLDRYELDIPDNYDHIQSLYDELKAKGSLSLKDALEVGISIEKVDIDDIVTAIKSTDNDDIKVVLVNIGGASYNHMKGFVNALENNNLTTEIDYSDYLTQELVDTKGTLKYLLAEKLESEGVDIPEQVSSEDMKANCDNEEQEKGYEGNKGKGKSESSQRNNEQANFNKYTNNSVLKAKYKSTYEVKYGSLISKMDDSSLESFISKIDGLLEKIEAGNYSDETRIKYNSMLLALKEIAVDNIDEDTILDELFN